MKTLLIRDIPDEIHNSLVAAAERARRSKEKQALHILETALADKPAETCGELLDWLEQQPPPHVDEKRIDEVLATRGRRSRRP